MTDAAITIRRPKPKELSALAKLFRQAVYQHFSYFPAHYQEEIIRQNDLRRMVLASLNRRRAIYVAVHNRQVIGYIIAGQGNGEGHVYWLFVDPEARGQNVGAQLLNRALDQLRQQGTTRVVLNTHDHQGYYTNHGFTSENTWEIHGVPVTRMSRELKS